MPLGERRALTAREPRREIPASASRYFPACGGSVSLLRALGLLVLPICIVSAARVLRKRLTNATESLQAVQGRSSNQQKHIPLMQTVELVEVTGKSAEEFSQPKKAVRSIHIQPLSSLLPKVSPICDLQMTTKRLQRVDRIYAVANLAAVSTLATSLVYTFLTCISVF
jgi:hypothetical protein